MQKFVGKKIAFTHIVPYNSLTYKNQCCFMQSLNIGVMVSDVYWVFFVWDSGLLLFFYIPKMWDSVHTVPTFWKLYVTFVE